MPGVVRFPFNIGNGGREKLQQYFGQNGYRMAIVYLS